MAKLQHLCLFPLLLKTTPCPEPQIPRNSSAQLRPQMAPSGTAVCPLPESLEPPATGSPLTLRPWSPEGRGLCRGLACPLLLSMLGKTRNQG